MIISLDNLRAELIWWEKNDWEQDILSDAYYQIYDVRSAGVTRVVDRNRESFGGLEARFVRQSLRILRPTSQHEASAA